MTMKKSVSCFLAVGILSIMIGCASVSDVYIPGSVSTKTYHSVYIDLTYDPTLLITVQEKKAIISDLTSRLGTMGFLVIKRVDEADMTLKINIDELLLSDRNDRLTASTTFGLAKGESLMTYTATCIDARTFAELAKISNTNTVKRYFPSMSEIKKEFFEKMKNEIVDMIYEAKTF